MKNAYLIIGMAALLFSGCHASVNVDDPYQLDTKLVKQLEESGNVHSLMKEFNEDSGMSRWEGKEVLEFRELPLAEDFASVTFTGDYASLSVSADTTHSGKGSVCLTTRTSGPVKNPTNRNYGSPEITRHLDGEDLTQWNRFSCWVYVDAPGYYISFLGFKLLNEGVKPMPTPGRFEGEHFVSVHPGEWTHIIWEIPDLYRDKVTGFTANIMMTGECSGGSDHLRLYVDDMRLEKVAAENTRGFNLRENAIAYSHNGYRLGARKQALAQNLGTTAFTVRNDVTGKVAYKGNGTEIENGFVLMDFSSLEKKGRYTLETGGIVTKPFFVGDAAYLATAWHLLNFFFAERCGFDQPGIHQPCHQDAFIHHPDGRTISMAGGWHDAADLSQGTPNDCEACIALLELAEQVKDKDPKLYKRTLEEVRWGLTWLLKTRFGDGYRPDFLIMSIWTLNTRGDKDDMDVVATKSIINNLRAAEAEAMAVKHFEAIDPVFAFWCRQSAIEDFDFGMQELYAGNVYKTNWNDSKNATEQEAMAVCSAMRLYDLTGEEKYINVAAERASKVMAAQEMGDHSNWTMPVSGYFYESDDCKRPIEYYHQSQEHRMAQGISLLLKACPNHPDAARWTASLKAYADYLKVISGVMEPYGLLPAAVYQLNNTEYEGMYHEGEKIGLPSMEEFNAQVANGIHLADDWYLRKFPVGYQYRGFNATALTKAKAAFILAQVFDDPQLKDIAMRQVEWVTGFNPFACSTIYGDGYDYPMLYGAYAGDVVGAVPVGIETFENDDEPYFPMQNNCTYKEIWTHSTARMVSCVAEMFKY